MLIVGSLALVAACISQRCISDDLWEVQKTAMGIEAHVQAIRNNTDNWVTVGRPVNTDNGVTVETRENPVLQGQHEAEAEAEGEGGDQTTLQ